LYIYPNVPAGNTPEKALPFSGWEKDLYKFKEDEK